MVILVTCNHRHHGIRCSFFLNIVITCTMKWDLSRPDAPTKTQFSCRYKLSQEKQHIKTFKTFTYFRDNIDESIHSFWANKPKQIAVPKPTPTTSPKTIKEQRSMIGSPQRYASCRYFAIRRLIRFIFPFNRILRVFRTNYCGQTYKTQYPNKRSHLRIWVSKVSSFVWFDQPPTIYSRRSLSRTPDTT